jgi:hypothetical protein
MEVMNVHDIELVRCGVRDQPIPYPEVDTGAGETLPMETYDMHAVYDLVRVLGMVHAYHGALVSCENVTFSQRADQGLHSADDWMIILGDH